MDTNPQPLTCRNCNAAVASNYCPECGQKAKVNRITMPSLLHEVFHFFTHLDKGFPYTLKRLIVSPGRMQRDYLEGDRARHQKPFSMFFLSATISALVYYWINRALLQYWSAGDQHEGEFFNHYWVLFHSCLFPLYALITYGCFRKAGYNYGEIGVFQLYTFSILFLVLALIQTSKFLNHSIETRYLEVPVMFAYTTITNLNFLQRLRRGPVILLSLLNIGLTFAAAAFIQDRLIEIIYKH